MKLERDFICQDCGDRIKIWYQPKDLDGDLYDIYFCPVCNGGRLRVDDN